MPLYTTLAALSQTPASNAADGTVDAPSTIDNQTNLLASFTARVRDGDINTPFGTVASAATVVLDGTVGNVNISGTTAITAITLAEGSQKLCRFATALTLTNGASLVLPGAANITTAAGDYAVFTGRASGVVECTEYQTASYPPKPANSLVGTGYHKLPSGLIIQWGSTVGTTNVASSIAISFPLTFATPFSVVAINGDVGQTVASVSTNWAPPTSGFNATFVVGGTGVGTGVVVRCNWVAVGV